MRLYNCGCLRRSNGALLCTGCQTHLQAVRLFRRGCSGRTFLPGSQSRLNWPPRAAPVLSDADGSADQATLSKLPLKRRATVQNFTVASGKAGFHPVQSVRPSACDVSIRPEARSLEGLAPSNQQLRRGLAGAAAAGSRRVMVISGDRRSCRPR